MVQKFTGMQAVGEIVAEFPKAAEILKSIELIFAAVGISC